jgi:CHAD domain-containing protein
LRRFGRLDAEARVELREALKDLRYATEFFAGVFPDMERARDAFLATLKGLLDNLDRLKDFTVHARLQQEFMASWTSEGGDTGGPTAQKAFAMGFALGRQELERAACARAVEKGGRKLARLGVGWG